MKYIRVFTAVAVALLPVLTGCNKQKASVSEPITQVAPHASINPAPHSPIVTMVTPKGAIIIKLFPADAPISCTNFEKLINKGFYNGLTFHRIADLGAPGASKIVQGGDPEGTGNGGPGWTIKGEFKANGVNNPLTHVPGAVAMARSNDNDSAGSQFYICVNQVHSIDSKYAVFGMVIKGLDVANKLEIGDKMTKVTVQE